MKPILDFHISVRINPEHFRLLTPKQTKAVMEGIAHMLNAGKAQQ